jgi:hypothetical protein
MTGEKSEGVTVNLKFHDWEAGATKTITVTLSDEQIDEILEEQAKLLKKPLQKTPDKK